MNTDVELVKELEERNVAGRYDELIANAKKGMYHDFKSTIATPKMDLVMALKRFPELGEIRAAVINGEYDEEWPNKVQEKTTATGVKEFGTLAPAEEYYATLPPGSAILYVVPIFKMTPDGRIYYVDPKHGTDEGLKKNDPLKYSVYKEK